jgi:hypothetical protein
MKEVVLAIIISAGLGIAGSMVHAKSNKSAVSDRLAALELRIQKLEDAGKPVKKTMRVETAKQVKVTGPVYYGFTGGSLADEGDSISQGSVDQPIVKNGRIVP